MPYVSITETVDEYKLAVTPSFQNDVKSFLFMIEKEQAFEKFQLKYFNQGKVASTFTFGRKTSKTECVNLNPNSNSKPIDKSSYIDRHATFNAALLEHMKKHGWKWLNYNRSDQKENPTAEWTFEKCAATSKGSFSPAVNSSANQHNYYEVN